MKVSELKKQLKQHGCYHDNQDYTGHERWYSPKTGKYFPVPRHDSKEVATGTLNRIYKDAGLK